MLPPRAPVGTITRWYDDVQVFALGILRLTPWDLQRYTLREFGHLVEGWSEVQRRERRARAELAVWLLSPWCGRGRRLTIGDLVGGVPRGGDD